MLLINEVTVEGKAVGKAAGTSVELRCVSYFYFTLQKTYAAIVTTSIGGGKRLYLASSMWFTPISS